MHTIYFHDHSTAFVLAILQLHSFLGLRTTLLFPLTTENRLISYLFTIRRYSAYFPMLNSQLHHFFFLLQQAGWLDSRLLAVTLNICYVLSHAVIWSTYHIRKMLHDTVLDLLLLFIYIYDGEEIIGDNQMHLRMDAYNDVICKNCLWYLRSGCAE